ncbi:MAG: Endonuclease/Exonuclease/phosphatase family protein, partial [Nocardioides sp.]|nr:Endonuclease/Exonuclease/phosphatase family protein [Nocardioides sp.]
MPSPSLSRSVSQLLSGALFSGALFWGIALVLGVTLLSAPAGAQQAEGAQRRNTNPTGTASGSLANGAGNLKVRLAATTDGRIKVSWRRPGPASRLRKLVVQVGPGRTMATKVRSYRLNRRKQSLVVDRAFGATPASGNYTFVKVLYVRRDRSRSGSPAKWIQAPITSPCTAAAKDQVTVAAFNVKNWTGNTAGLNSWNHRGPNVVSEILRSGADAVAIQEASGKGGKGF